MYMPFDNVDASINLGDARLFTQFVIRSAAAGAVITLSPQFREFATLINGRVGRVPEWLGPMPPPTSARIRASVESSCDPTSSTLRGTGSCRSV